MDDQMKDDDLEETAVGRAPGKLYVAGEYAVVEPGHRAIVVAVNRFLDVRIHASDFEARQGSLQSNRFTRSRVQWHRSHDTIVVDSADQSGWGFIINAIRVVERFAVEAGKSLRYCDISVSSGLDDASGKKYGLGSSGAVTVATVQALCDFYHLEIGEMERYKLAFLAANEVQPSGSGGDIAAGTFQGCIAYSSPDHEWIAARVGHDAQTETLQRAAPSVGIDRTGLDRRSGEVSGIARLIGMDWPGLSIERLPVPSDMKFLVGWTGAPASTPELVANVQHSVHGGDITDQGFAAESGDASERVRDTDGKSHDSPALGLGDAMETSKERYGRFVRDSDACVTAMADAFRRGDVSAIQTQIRAARRILLSLTDITGTIVETRALNDLVRIAQSHGAAAKSSGAGGGDCGIAIGGPEVDSDAIRADWNACGIEALDLHISTGDE
ncbi:MAG: phosphomevalonate kinase [Bifidobacterium sp.]|uniref:phosphomevalonate kinase n=2 Tax=Bifidobacterium fermentum TaxID=3059035 RepID=A0AB39UB23_9BIFI